MSTVRKQVAHNRASNLRLLATLAHTFTLPDLGGLPAHSAHLEGQVQIALLIASSAARLLGCFKCFMTICSNMHALKPNAAVDEDSSPSAFLVVPGIVIRDGA